ncbi:MAG: sn-glycerol-3-phosphate ABC transporter ATP-binding protein UgpC [Ilumatobacteraceae bacterium]|nr:sn-glycerol-3-phosphate ABC transporter ATP-binding protein UgpC [Ilumatobacteraceae bacterium]
MASVALDKINKVYENGFHAIHDLSLSVDDGEFIVLVGPSGCGKSTALRMIAGLETITDGVMRIGDRIVNDIAPKDRDIAMVFQNYALYPHMTVRENIGFALKLAKTSKADIDAQVRKAAGVLELTQLLDRKPGQLSGGQRQRVAMGRAIVRQPAAFLMDEPLSNLDAKLRVQMRAEIASLQRTLGVTTVYVTHDQTEAMTMGDRVAVLKDGYLQQVDTPQNLYDHPSNVFVAAFIGSPSMNLYDAVVTIAGDSGLIQLGSQQLQLAPESLADRPALRTYDSRPIVLGVRPEDFEDASMAHNTGDGSSLKARVTLLESLGSEIMAHFALDATRVDSGDPDGAQETAVTGASNAVGRFHPRSRVRVGDTIEVAVGVENLHFFDHDTHEAIWD